MTNNVFLGEQAAHMIAHGIDEIISKNKVNYHLTEDGSGIQIDGGFGEINIFGIDYNNLIETIVTREYIAKENCYVEAETYSRDNRDEYYYVNNTLIGKEYGSGEMIYLHGIFLKKGDILTFREGVSHETTIRVFGLYNIDFQKNEKNNKHNYSTEEQVIGTWADGKPIYEITIDLGEWITNSSLKYDVTHLDIDEVIFLDASWHQTNQPNYRGTISTTSGIDNRYLFFDGTYIKGASGWFVHRYITIQYTKTTD